MDLEQTALNLKTIPGSVRQYSLLGSYQIALFISDVDALRGISTAYSRLRRSRDTANIADRLTEDCECTNDRRAVFCATRTRPRSMLQHATRVSFLSTAQRMGTRRKGGSHLVYPLLLH